jgi:hypothetical protein
VGWNRLFILADDSSRACDILLFHVLLLRTIESRLETSDWQFDDVADVMTNELTMIRERHRQLAMDQVLQELTVSVLWVSSCFYMEKP